MVITTPAILSKPQGIYVVPILSLGWFISIGFLFGGFSVIYISAIPSISIGFARFISTITLSALFIKDGELPIPLVGIIFPSSVIASASTIATSTLGIVP